MESVIDVRDVNRFFKSTKRKDGLKGAFQLLIKPEVISHQALKNINIRITSGEFVGLIGANGAGKTTLLKILSGLIPASSGSVKVLNDNPFLHSIPFRKKIALVMGQKAQLWWDLPALDAFDLLRAIYEIPKNLYQQRVHELGELLDVKRHFHTQIRRLSLGERMKMELIGALLHWPSVIFLDEPTIGLDILAAKRLREFLKTFNQREKATVILTSHNMDDIETLCSRVLILKSGELIFDGNASGLIQQDERRLRIRFASVPTIDDLVRQTGLDSSSIKMDPSEIEGERAGMYYFKVHTLKMMSLLQDLFSHFQIIDMRIEEQGLDEIVQKIYHEEPSTMSS